VHVKGGHDSQSTVDSSSDNTPKTLEEFSLGLDLKVFRFKPLHRFHLKVIGILTVFFNSNLGQNLLIHLVQCASVKL